MANIKDVALRAGVSATTVSHVVNQTRFVTETARLRVLEAVQALGYVPSGVARSLKHNATRILGMLIPNNSNPYFAEILRGVEARCYEAGYNVLLGNSDDDPVRQAAYLRVLAEQRVDGLILVTAHSGPGGAVLAEPLGPWTIPVVMVDREVPGLAGDLVAVDHVLGGLLATRHLLTLGHPWVACIGGPPELSSADQRRRGWQQALAEAGVARRPGDGVAGDFSSAGGYQAMRLLLRHRPRPSAVFVCNDLMAFGALAACQEAGVRVPHQLALVGYDDIQLAAFSTPALTTVVQPKRQMGILAADLLLERIQTGRRQARRVILEPLLKIRGSSSVTSEARRS
jgi:LacI family transcriptional regulator